MNSRNRKIIAMIISVVLSIVVLGASVFIADNTNHKCTGQDCPICTAIEQCENTLHALGLAVFGVFFVSTALSVILRELICKLKSVSRKNTLITLKVELLS